jgi:hypothetical protein
MNKLLEQDRALFEAWHNEFYGPQGKYNPIRSLDMHPEETGLGYEDPTVQAQFVSFRGALASLAPIRDKHLEPIGFATWNTGTNPGTRLMRHDGLVAVSPTKTDFYHVPVYTDPADLLTLSLATWRVPVSGEWFYGRKENCQRERAQYESTFTAEDFEDGEGPVLPEALYSVRFSPITMKTGE